MAPSVTTKEADAGEKSMNEKNRRSTKPRVVINEDPVDQSEVRLSEEIKCESEESKPHVTEEKLVEDDSQIKLIKNFKLDSDDEIEVSKNTPITTIEVQRKLYLQECKKLNVIPIRALAELTENTRELNFSHFNLGPKGAMALTFPLHLSSVFIKLDMEDNDIGPEGCQWIAEMLLENNSIEDVNLAYNNIGSHGLACISRVFKNNISIAKLNLSGNGLGDTNTNCLAHVFQHPFLKELHLSRNDFEDNTAKIIGDQLGEHSIENVGYQLQWIRL